MGGGPGNPVSPWLWSSGSDYLGRQINLTFNYNDATRALISLVAVRDPGCVWGHIEFGLGVQTKTVPVPSGTTTVTAGQMAARGFDVIEDVWALNITVA